MSEIKKWIKNIENKILSDFDENLVEYRINNADSEYVIKSFEYSLKFVEHESRISFNWEKLIFSIQKEICNRSIPFKWYYRYNN